LACTGSLTCLARGFLLEEPGELLRARLRFQPRKKRIALPWPDLLQVLEPVDKAIGVGRSPGRFVDDLCAQLFQETAFEPRHAKIALHELLPIDFRKARLQPFAVPVCQPALE
jgi:hypothetical protein